MNKLTSNLILVIYVRRPEWTSWSPDAFTQSDTYIQRTTNLQIGYSTTPNVLPHGLALLPGIGQQKTGECRNGHYVWSTATRQHNTKKYWKWLDLLQDIAILTYKVRKNLVPKYIEELFLKNNGSYNLCRLQNTTIQHYSQTCIKRTPLGNC